MLTSQPDYGAQRFVAETLLARVDALAQEREGVRAAEDIECIHRMRVATRRLRAALRLFAPLLPAKRVEAWLRDVRRITRALGAARDADVQIAYLDGVLAGELPERARPGVQRVRLRLRQARERLQTGVLRALDRLVEDRLIESMEEYLRTVRAHACLQGAEPTSPALMILAGEAVTARLAELLGYEPYVHQPERVAELHAMRIAAKRLRYTLELFTPLFAGELKTPLKTAKVLQELLGDIHDADVWLERLPHVLEEERTRALDYLGHTRGLARLVPGLQTLAADRQALRDTRYRDFTAAWAGTPAIWQDLLSTLRAAGGDAQEEAE